MDSNSVSPLPDNLAPIAEFDKSPPTPPDEVVPMDELPPPPGGVTDDDKDSNFVDDWRCWNWCEYVLVVVFASLLCVAATVIAVFWVLTYKDGFDFNAGSSLTFNYHPVLMICGFITLSGFSLMMFRICRCFRRIWVKLFHTIFHALAVVCIMAGFFAVYRSQDINENMHFKTLHSWVGICTIALFALQFIAGFFTFLLLLCCDRATACFRAAMVPIHSSFGLVTFFLAVATCLTGLMDSSITAATTIPGFRGEPLLLNVLAIVLVALVLLVAIALRCAPREDASQLCLTTRAKICHTSSRVTIGTF